MRSTARSPPTKPMPNKEKRREKMSLLPGYRRAHPGTQPDYDGRSRFITIRPGEYPWRNHYNAWRPAHIHFSLFGQAFMTRMVTQMYFPGDSLIPYDPMFTCIADENARQRLISVLDWENTIPEHALGYRFDIVLRGREATPMEE